MNVSKRAQPAEAAPSKVPHAADPWLTHLVSQYGDMLYDLCQTLLWSSDEAPYSYRRILQRLVKTRKRDRFQKYERAWVLHLALRELETATERLPRKLTPAEQVMLDSSPDPKARLRHFDSYFHKLDFASQSLLVLTDRYRLSFLEVAAVFEAPEESLRLQRTQALRQLKSWIWSESDDVL